MFQERIVSAAQHHAVCSGLNHRICILFDKSLSLRRLKITSLNQLHQTVSYFLYDFHLFTAGILFRSSLVEASLQCTVSCQHPYDPRLGQRSCGFYSRLHSNKRNIKGLPQSIYSCGSGRIAGNHDYFRSPFNKKTGYR